jgi:hypothetical protein
VGSTWIARSSARNRRLGAEAMIARCDTITGRSLLTARANMARFSPPADVAAGGTSARFHHSLTRAASYSTSAPPPGSAAMTPRAVTRSTTSSSTSRCGPTGTATSPARSTANSAARMSGPVGRQTRTRSPGSSPASSNAAAPASAARSSSAQDRAPADDSTAGRSAALSAAARNSSETLAESGSRISANAIPPLRLPGAALPRAVPAVAVLDDRRFSRHRRGPPGRDGPGIRTRVVPPLALLTSRAASWARPGRRWLV